MVKPKGKYIINKSFILILSFHVIVSSVLFNFNYVFAVQSVSGVSEPGTLYEYDLDGAKIYITSTNVQFKPAISSVDLELVNGPTSLTIQSFQRIDAYHVALTLSNNFTNLTQDYTSFFVRVLSTGTQNGEVLETNVMPIYYETEPSDYIMASPQPKPLTEGNLDGAVIRLYVKDTDMFRSDASQNLNSFQLVNAPPGLTVASFSGDDTRIGYVTLAYDGTDFDSDYPNFRILLEGTDNDGDGKPGIWDNGTDEMSDPIPITAINEATLNASFTSNPSSLSETNLNGAKLDMTISGDVFQYNIFNASYFVLNNAPAGTSILNIERIDDQNARLTLSYSGDFDNDINNFSVTVLENALTGNTQLTTNTSTITAVVESSSSLTTSPSSLSESNLNGSTLNVSLTAETYVGSINSSQFNLNNAPTGTSISSVTRVNDTNVEIVLAFNGTDFDANITNFFVTISSSALTNTSSNLNTNSVTITGEIEPLTSVASTIPNNLYEPTLNGSHVIVTITDDTFKTSLNIADIQLINAPSGLSVSNVVRNSATEAEITLTFDGTDFDVDVSGFRIDVLSSGLAKAPSASSNTMTIQAAQEIEGLTNYTSTGTSYPTVIEMSGYNTRAQKLYVNSTLHTENDVTGKTATFYYFIKVYDGNGNTLGNLGDLNTPLSVTGNAGEKDVDIRNLEIPLSQGLTSSFRIVVIIKSVNVVQ